MTQQAMPMPLAGDVDEERSGLATGFIVFAAVMMMLAGSFQAVAGLVGIFQDDFYVTTSNYLLRLDTTTWGWIHLLLGVLVLLVGFAVLSGRTWGRVVGIGLASLSALANFIFIPYYPVWSLVVIAVDVFVIWALAAHGRQMAH
ncbi:hypothetical protein BCE75_11468 [Isoptericola sp. CG 20/1183]|uniref:DUF7144 domain-containing protein n=1 Tax=Isoptericola halotolerans TaxID=300560 RepID=A0ABX5ECK9_9MICO|nr:MULTISPECIES: hypothetical protein [Isoptericola]PRZ03255.1 hypothetical protein BCE75_11468 [Isoptericola sp. CG 20/1183]PRZ03533.1 hypothetical protein BCL65_11333 [Isoptericola halotolerans]